jgi:hypothetical protein
MQNHNNHKITEKPCKSRRFRAKEQVKITIEINSLQGEKLQRGASFGVSAKVSATPCCI